MISEFMASNDKTLADEDGEFKDWIEIHNPDATPVSLAGWHLTDNSSSLTKWTFPAVTLGADEYLVIFASGKDRSLAGNELHTNFSLSSGGEYLALVQADGITKTSEFTPTFPEQSKDVSYGYAGASSMLVERSNAISYWIPDSGGLGTSWTARAFDNSGWVSSASIQANFPSTDVNKNTVQSNTITSNLTVNGSTSIEDIDVHINIDHNYDSDLTVTLRSPEGTVVTLFDGIGGSGNNFTGTILDDQAGSTIDAGSPPYSDRFQPQGNLSDFNGEGSAGVWVLSITDGGRTSRPRTGTLNSWSVDITGGATATTLQQGLGYEDNPGSSDHFNSEISTQLPSGTTTAYVRIPFNAENIALINSLVLSMKYDDGFIAYLNGVKVAEANAPSSPTWQSTATAGHNDSDALQAVAYDISAHIGSLVEGENILAVHMLNQNSGSSDFLMSAELQASQSFDYATSLPGFLTAATPGSANNATTRNTGPYIEEVTEDPAELLATSDQIVTARLGEKSAPVAGASLFYRTNYGAEQVLNMNDSGTGGDSAAGDGIWSATIPSSAYSEGDMLRWYVLAQDTLGQSARAPMAVDPLAAEYYGVAVSDGVSTNGIARFRWWVQDPDWYWTGSVGSSNIHKEYTDCSVWYDGQFYDNVRVRTRGASSVYGKYPKQSLHFNFHTSKRFVWLDGGSSTDRVNLNNIWVDQAYLRNDLSMKTFATSGAVAPVSRMVLVHRPGSDPTVSNLVEHPNAAFLERHGLDPGGALYKIYNRLADASTRPEWTPGAAPNGLVGVEKKTREDENNDDLQSFINVLADSNPNRQRDLLDQLDLPQIINYMATSVLDQGLDVFAKNNFVYRDTNGSGEWQMIPWDRDVSWGPERWNNNNIIYSSSSKSHPYFGSGINGGERYPIFEAVIDEPITREMFLRRLRTLMDEQLQAPGTASGSLLLESQIQDFVIQTQRINTPGGEADNWVQQDKDDWGKLRGDQSSSLMQSFDDAISDIIDDYLPNRRIHLFQTMGPSGEGIIPAQQTTAPQVVIGSIDYNPASGNQDEEYIEIVNEATEAVDISNWSLTGGVTHTFAKGTVIPGYDVANPEANRLYLSPSSYAFRSRALSPRGGENRLVQSAYSGHLSSFGETLTLLDADNLIVDSSSYEGTPSDEQLYLAVTEIMYHPLATADTEFIELTNTSATEALDLSGVQFTRGITFDFAGSAVTELLPGESVLVIKDQAAFETVYGSGLAVAGVWTGSLNNDGETIKLEDATSSTIKEFTYNDALPWPLSADGQGASLVLIHASSNPDPDLASNWRASAIAAGTPGSDEILPTPPSSPFLDLDQNGKADIIDYAIAGKPRSSVVSLDPGTGQADYLTLSFSLYAAAESAKVTVEYSNNLIDWYEGNEHIQLVTESYGSDGTVTYVWQALYPQSTGARQFLRLKVNQP